MNELQQFMAGCFAQVDSISQEDVVIGGETLRGTFGDPTMMPIMTRNGSINMIVTTLQVARALFAAPPAEFTEIMRPATATTYFVQMIDTGHPTVYTFMLTDRRG